MTYRDPKTGRWATPHPFGDAGGGLSQPLPKAQSDKTLVFVYGTLKKGYGNHARLLHHARFVGDARTVDNFRMISWGAPMIFRDGTHPVRGEVYEVDSATLKNLDRLEGYRGNSQDSMYDRIETMVRVTSPKGNALADVKALVYVAPPKHRNTEAIGSSRNLVRPDKDGLLTWGYPVRSDDRGEQED